MLAGGLSPYGTDGQGGNVWEWEETEYDLVNDSSSSIRGIRGGDLYYGSIFLQSWWFWGQPNPEVEDYL